MAKSKRKRPKEFWDKLVGKECGQAMTTLLDTRAKELTPDQFRLFAAERNWPLEVIETLLKEPVIKCPFFIGLDKVDQGGRQLVVIKKPEAIKPLRSAA